MQDGLSRRTLGRAAVATVASFGILRHARGEEALRLRCSLDTAPSHIRNVSVTDYLKKVEAATGGKIAAGDIWSRQRRQVKPLNRDRVKLTLSRFNLVA